MIRFVHRALAPMQVFVVMSLVVAADGCARKSGPEPVWIGHAVPLSGKDKAAGELALLGVRLAVDEYNAEMGEGRRVAVDHADTCSDSDTARAVVRRLLTVNKVSAILGGEEIAQLANLASFSQSSAVPFVLAGGPPQSSVNEFIYYTGLGAAEQGRALARFCLEQFKGKKAAVLTDGTRDAVVDAFTRALPPTSHMGTWRNEAAGKLRGAANALLAQKPGVILFVGQEREFVELVGFEWTSTTPVLFAGAEGGLAALQNYTIVPEVFLVTTFVATEDSVRIREFGQLFRKKFEKAPDVFAALAYDNARILFHAMREAKSWESARWREALNTAKIEGLTGPLQFDSRHIAARSLSIVKIQGGRSSVVQRFDPNEK